MSQNDTRTVSIDSKNDFIAQVRETGVVFGDDLVHTEGEGRATRYFIGGEQVKKGQVEDLFESPEFEGEAEVPVEGDEPEHGTIACEYCGKEVGYLTGSHMKSHDEDGPQSVPEYRQRVAEVRGVEPSDVPLAPDQLNELFQEAGQLDEETRQQLSEMNKARWEAGEYDHLRKEDDEADGEEVEPAIVEVEA